MTSENYFLPPEWSPQSGVMLTWPHSETIWAETLTDVDPIFAQIALHITERAKLIITHYDDAHKKHIESYLRDANVNLAQVAFYQAPSNDVWVRDHGPITVKQGEANVLLDFTFNGWGDKYPAEFDNEITRSLYAQSAFADANIKTIDMVLEGGGIEVDGKGTLLTTRSCLLAKTRNPHLTQEAIEKKLQTLFGIKRVLWLDHGYLAGDDTDGHIDTLARFVDEKTICYIQCDDETDEHYAALQAMEAELKTFTNFEGEPYRLIPLPWPKARYADYDGRRLPASYANFLILNDAILAPIYDDEADEKSLHTLKSCFPQHKIIPIPSVPIIQWYGSIHCMTMQLPRGVV